MPSHRLSSKKHARSRRNNGSGPCWKVQMPVHSRNSVKRLSRTFPAQLSAFEQLKALIEEFGDAADLGREDRHKLTLIVEELFTNTVNHGHRGDSDAPIFITFEEDKGDVQLIYEDSAPKFDPLAAGNRADIDSTIKERRVG